MTLASKSKVCNTNIFWEKYLYTVHNQLRKQMFHEYLQKCAGKYVYMYWG
jgi:hypothetical protein